MFSALFNELTSSASLVGKLVFSVSTGSSQQDLWVSDGTEVGTIQIQGVHPVLAPSPSESFITLNGTVYFLAAGPSGVELWRTDGTAAGTAAMQQQQTFSTSGSSARLLTSGADGLYVVASGEVADVIWKIPLDGSAPVALSLAPSISSLSYLGGSVLFVVHDSVAGNSLNIVDQSGQSRALLEHVWPSAAGAVIGQMVDADGFFAFTVRDPVHGQELWRTDGTTAGTTRIGDIAGADNLLAGDGVVYFTVNGGATLWRTDGTAAGTVLVADPSQGGASNISDLHFMGAQIVFTANDGVHGTELWVSDGAPGGAHMVADIAPGSTGSNPLILSTTANSVTFRATNSTSGSEIWHSDGTSAGTIVDDRTTLADPTAAFQVSGASKVGDRVIFVANDGQLGAELWASDGGVNAPHLLADIRVGSEGSKINIFGSTGSQLFFSADSGTGFSTLWVTDGTAAGTHSIEGPAMSSTTKGVVIDGILYFSADPAGVGAALWRSDGTAQGTFQVVDTTSDTAPTYPRDLITLDGVAYFVAADTTHGRELWRSDGTSGGTTIVTDIVPGITGSDPQTLGVLNGRLLFTANVDASSGRELWVSDGTASGTHLLKDINPGVANSSITGGVTAGEAFFFVARSADKTYGLWATDGTSAGTVLLSNNWSGVTTTDELRQLTAVDGKVFFTMDLTGGGSQLWSSNGTASGTAKVLDINPSSPLSTIHDAVAAGSLLYFTADDGVHGRELWVSDGTAAGTHLVEDINPGLGNADIHGLSVVDGKLYFQATDGVNGPELWVSNGTAAGTHMVTDTTKAGSSYNDVLVGGVIDGSVPSQALSPSQSQLFGAETAGGGGGRIIHVTSLAASGPGTLADALAQEGPRTIVFDVAGRINLTVDSSLIIKNPYVTIDGSSAPYPGVTISGGTLGINTHDVIVQGLAIRPGDQGADGNHASGESLDNRDAIGIYSNSYNVLIQNNSLSWATDEIVQIWGTNTHDITVRNNIIAQGLYDAGHPEGVHSDGFIIGYDAKNVAVYQNLFIDNARRNPVLQNGAEAFIANNITFYSAVDVHFLSEPAIKSNFSVDATLATIINNITIAGLDQLAAPFLKVEAVLNNGSHVYVDGNITPDGALFLSWKAGTPPPSGFIVDTAPVTLKDYVTIPTDQLLALLNATSGAHPYAPDAIDLRILADLKSGLGGYVNTATEAGGYLEDDHLIIGKNATSANLVSTLLANDLYYQGGRIVSVNTAATHGQVSFDANSQTLTYSATGSYFDALDSSASTTDTFIYFVQKGDAILPVTVSFTVRGADYVPFVATQGDDHLVYVAGEAAKQIDGQAGDDSLTVRATTIAVSGVAGYVLVDANADGARDLAASNVEHLSLVGRQITLKGDLTAAGLNAASPIIVKLSDLGGTLDASLITSGQALSVQGGAGVDVIRGGLNGDLLDGGLGADTLMGGQGDDIYVVDNAGDIVTEFVNAGVDLVRTGLATYALGSNIENLTYTGAGDFSGFGNSLGNIITGGSGADILDGGAGADTLIGGLGDDTYLIESSSDVVIEAANGGVDTVRTALSYTLTANVENLVILGALARNGTGNALDNILIGNASANVLNGDLGADTLIGGQGNDTYVVDNIGDVVVEAADGGLDLVRTTLAAYTLGADVENLTYAGTSAFYATGNQMANVITGGAGDDVLDGGAGADTLIGGLGNDTYVVDNAGDIVTEGANAGLDLIQTTLSSYALGANLENLTYLGTSAFLGAGNTLANTITGGAGNDLLDGGAGADTLIGGQGDDVYVVDSAGDVVVEMANGGVDTVRTSLSYALGANLENLTLTGAISRNATGNALDNVLIGNSANNVLDGDLGGDTMIGGLGNDTYVVDDVRDVVVEDADAGVDLVRVSLAAYGLAANFENLTFTGSGAFVGAGNSLNNILTGGAGSDWLDGGVGADTMVGGLGDDTFVVDNVLDVVTEASNAGNDLVRTVLSSYVLGANLENLVYTGLGDFSGVGNTLANVITGGAGADTLDGKSGADTLIGGLGDDTYVVDNAADAVVEAANAGIDLVRSAVSYTLSANVENLILTGSSAINGVGNGMDNVLIGNGAVNNLQGAEGADFLDGGAGADTLVGGTGDDTYVVDNAGDLVVEAANGGNDTVQASLSYTLTANTENLVLTGALAINGVGNSLNNVLTGNGASNILKAGDGNDWLDGAAGADTLVGGLGDDIYVVDDYGDVVTEDAEAGNDLVRTSLATFALGANLENLTYIGAASFTAVGNGLNNIITGGAGNDWLDGGAGADTLAGGAGDDTYLVDDAGDLILEGAAAGNDMVRTSLTTFVLGANLENLSFIGAASFTGVGNSLNNIITGSGSDDLLDGGLGADTLIGGSGDDIYVVDDGGDVVLEGAGAGNDLVRTTLATFALGANLENLTYIGAASFTGVGNSLDNVITGGVGNDWLDGGAGADTLAGGMGDDTYLVENAGDLILEGAGAGNDLVRTSLASFGLGANLENLTYVGAASFTGAGNSLNNVITGGVGNDWLDGGAGDDVVVGGTGDDTYLVDDAGDLVLEGAGAGNDLVQTSLASFGLGANLENLTYIGAASFTGVGNSLDNIIIGGAGNDWLDGGAGADILAGGMGDDTYLVDNAGDLILEGAGAGNDLVRTSLATFALSANLENLTYVGAASFTGTGNGLDNIIVGAAGNDWLDGGAGADTMTGGMGDDTYVVDNIGDLTLEGAGAGNDLVRTSLTTFALGANLENLTYIGAASFTGVGNGLNNIVTGGAGNDWLDGGAGADVLAGGMGDDTYVVDDSGDAVTETAGGGLDAIYASVSYSLSANVENLFLTGSSAINGVGNGLDNVLVGNGAANNLQGRDGADFLDGGAGADTMVGGVGDDTYVVDNAGDVVTEAANGGVDTVQTLLVGYTLGTNVENLTYIGAGDFNAVGNAVANVIIGGSGADVLDGKGGADTLIGGLGDDTYVIDNVADLVVELAGGGVDTIRTSVSYALGENVENLVLFNSSAINGVGNGLDNTITGNAGANVIDGGAGADLLTGGKGNDTFVFRAGQAQGDTVFDFTGAGATVGDHLEFVGFGAGTLTRIGTTDGYLITPDAAHGGAAAAEVIHLNGVFNLDLQQGGAHNDILFA
jgi:serralysin